MTETRDAADVGLPGPGDGLLGPGDDRWSVASIDCWRGHWYPRIRGFRDAAEMIEAAIAQSGRSQDGLIYPFLACWRQHIELSLKALLLEIEALEDSPRTARHTHDLANLWNACRQRLVARYGENELYEHAGRVIGELQDLDPRADEFRYPLLRSGAPSLARVESLSFDRIGASLRALSDFFDIASTMVEVDADARNDALLRRACAVS